MAVTGEGPGIHFLATDARTDLPQGGVGEPAQTGNADRSFSVTNASPQSVEVYTLTVAAVNDTLYTYEANGETVKYTSDPSATTTEIQAGLVADHNNNPMARGLGEAGGADPDVVVTGLLAGQSFPVTTSDPNLTLVHTNDAAKADWIPVGRLLISQGFHPDEPVQLGSLPKAALLTAQVDTFVMVYDALVTVRASVTVEGQTYTAAIVMAGASDIATEGALLATAINDALPANSVLASFATATLTLTAEVAGKAFVSFIDFEAPVGASVDTGAAAKGTTGLSTDDLVGSLVGISRMHKTVENMTRFGDDPGYKPYSGVVVDADNWLWVDLDAGDTITAGGAVYCETGVAGLEGRMYPASSATRILVPRDNLKWQRAARDARDNIAVVNIRL